MSDNRVRIRAELEDQVSKGLAKIDGGFSSLAKSPGAQSVLAGVGLGVGASAWGLLDRAAGAVVDTVFDSVRAASDMNETVNKAGVIFGDAAAKVERFGEGAARNLGISKQAAIEAASGFGQFFEGAGQAADKAELMSEKMVGLASDLASFNNLDPTDVLQKLKSGLSGEAEPLRSVGVFLTEAAVKAEGMKLGLADAHGELTEGAKVLARYQLILDQTKAAQGDFSRTSDGLANSQRIVQAKLKDTEAELGEKLVPIFTEANRVLLLGLDKTTMSLEDMRAAAANGSQGAQRQLRTLATVADEVGISVDKAWELAGEGVALNAKAMTAALKDTAAAMNDVDAAANAANLLPFTKQAQGLADALHHAWQQGMHVEGELGGLVYTGIVQPWNQPKPKHKGTGGQRKHAAGGAVGPGWEGYVGEEGMEWLSIGAGGQGYVSPTSDPRSSSGGGGQPAVISIVLDGREIARVVDERLFYVASRAAPARTRA